MRYQHLLGSLLLCYSFLPVILMAQPTATYKSNLDLLAKERQHLWRDTLFYAAVPLPIPVVSNLYSGVAAWKKYQKCNTVYKYYQSAKILVESENNPELYSQRKQEKATRRLTKMLETLREEAQKDASQPHPLVALSEDQKNLNEQLSALTVLELAELLERANQSIPPCCGTAEAGLVNYNAYNLRYRIRTISPKDHSKSIFTVDIEKEEAKIYKLQN